MKEGREREKEVANDFLVHTNQLLTEQFSCYPVHKTFLFFRRLGYLLLSRANGLLLAVRVPSAIQLLTWNLEGNGSEIIPALVWVFFVCPSLCHFPGNVIHVFKSVI